MRRGELYRVYKPSAPDPKRYRVFAVVSRQVLIDSRFSTVICAPVYSSFDGLSTQVPVGIDQGLKHESSVHCDELISILKTSLNSRGDRLITIWAGNTITTDIDPDLKFSEDETAFSKLIIYAFNSIRLLKYSDNLSTFTLINP